MSCFLEQRCKRRLNRALVTLDLISYNLAVFTNGCTYVLRPHRMHEMRPFAIYDHVAWASVYLSVTWATILQMASRTIRPLLHYCDQLLSTELRPTQALDVIMLHIAHCYILKSFLGLRNSNVFTEAETGEPPHYCDQLLCVFDRRWCICVMVQCSNLCLFASNDRLRNDAQRRTITYCYSRIHTLHS